ncbi:phage tail protein [Escherichia coli]|uniref:phage tail protein n=1 Tax=Escherichia coli TaxID=562 RepID=UPI00025CAC47|nr:phage tail protein [Escherichia coli]EII64807.1 phage tail collar domain protein [Escherichia coli 2.4168]MDI0714328.1 phage tail protein [Escherichia coli]MDI0810863.1 phage tail protein [Escherichia coli]
MSKIVRYQGDVRAFASDAQGMERTVFGGTNQADDLTSQITASFLRGWGIVGASEHPSLEDFNAAMYAMSQFIAYQHQMGVPEWHAEQEYHIGSICTHNGESYQSLQNANIGSQPPSAKWTPVLTSKNGLANLRLGAGAPAIGIPFFWPSSAMPNTVMTEWADMVFLKFNGATFSAATYPKLALVIPSLTLPDARGEFPRIWDDGRGVDSGRALLSTQGDAVQRMTGSLSQMVYSIAQQASDINGVFSATSGTPNIVQAYSSAGALRYMNVSFDTQNVVRTSTETRSRNIAFNFLVRAK